jgi:hypothetical protein
VFNGEVCKLVLEDLPANVSPIVAMPPKRESARSFKLELLAPNWSGVVVSPLLEAIELMAAMMVPVARTLVHHSTSGIVRT